MIPKAAKAFCFILLSTMSVAQSKAHSAAAYNAAFDAVWRTVHEQFYDPAILGVDWRALGERYRTQLPAIHDDPAFVSMVREMLHRIPSSHLGFQSPGASYDTSIGALLRTVDKQDVVADVWLGTDAQQKGIKPGDIITNASGLDGTWGSFANVQVDTCSGELKSLHIRREDYGWPFERPSVRWQTLAPGPKTKIGYLHIQHFEDDVAPEVDQAMAELADTSALIIDVRNNSGGNASYIRLVSYLTSSPHLAFALLSRSFLNKFGTAPTQIPSETIAGLPKVTGAYTTDRIIAAFKQNGGGAAFYTEDLGSKRYRGKIIIMINQETASAAEGFAAVMKREPNVTLIGQPTAGAVVGAESFPIPGGWTLAVPTHSAWFGNGEIYRDEPTSPGIFLPFTRADLCKQQDTVLAKALSLVE